MKRMMWTRTRTKMTWSSEMNTRVEHLVFAFLYRPVDDEIEYMTSKISAQKFKREPSCFS